MHDPATVKAICEERWHNRPLRSPIAYVGWTITADGLVACRFRKARLKDVIGPRLRKLLGYACNLKPSKQITSVNMDEGTRRKWLGW